LSIGGGTGDAFSALFLGHYLNAGALHAGLERAVAAMFALAERTSAAGAEELELVAAQDDLVAPRTRFAAVRLR
jgi:pyridoxine kinase